MKINRKALTGSSLAIVGVLLIAVLVLSNVLLRGARLDLTENGLYTLSDGTGEVLKEIQEPVNLYFYFSDRGTAKIPMIRTYATRVREMLEEMASRSGGKLRLKVIDPLPFSEDEDRASGFGLQAVPAGAAGETIYFGLAGTNSTDGQSVIPFFQPDKEAFLEYDVVKLIHSLVIGKKPVVGVISGISMAGGFDAATRQTRDPWSVYQELSDMFDLRLINADGTNSIDSEIETLILVHPKGLSEEIQYAIDQFVLRGGRLAVFVDPHAEMDQSGNDVDDPNMARFASKSSDLPVLFKAWGVEYDPSKLVFDAGNALPIQASPSGPPVRHLAILGLGKDSLNRDERATAQLTNLNFSTTGQFTLAEGSTLKLIPLVQSSGDSMLEPVERIKFEMDPARLYDGFKPGNQHLVLAGRLDGKLKTAFPQRTGGEHLAESKDVVHILLIADTDVLTDRLWVQVQNFFGQKVMNAFANNGDFVINAIDDLAGSSALISIRGRASSARPFTTVEAIKRRADQSFRLKEQELQQELDETERKLTELQSGKEVSAAMIMSPEQQAEALKFQGQKVRIRKDLRQVRRQLDADIERLGNWLKVINIALVPLLLTLAALGFHFWRRRRTTAL
ncbi:MAG: Gldg family protein [Pseudomonadota bacterium]|nr:Gldg family protein [Pseudomonadota bacterium]